MNHIFPMLITVALLSCVPVSQAQDMQGPSWEMGWVTDVDPKYVVDLGRLGPDG